ncbi:amidase [Actibacterium sp. MT2.3-13A]|uniref:amidase n=1 Tax=Actibacterium sp. MT2.3-13A TaxID=2828332 RepID=UPI001BA56410|nr:amidase [Actibacterium sp. MT2.3-13A]
MADLEALSGRSAATIARALAAGEASPVALAELLLDRIAAQSSPVFLAVTRERALAEARAAQARLTAGRALSPLDGVPIAWKDLIDVAGTRTTAASDIYRDAEPARADAPIVANAAAAGMVSLGKLNLTEFAYSGLGLNPHYGTPVNPNDPATPRAPGGSSSGSGVAVASGLAPVAIGTDTGGSVRIPSAFNGVVGYKSSEGRISTAGVFALSRTHDTIGPLARSVEDCVLSEMVLRGAATSAVRRRPAEGLRIFVPETVVLDDLDPAVAANFEASLRRLEAAGARIERGPLPPFAEALRLAGEIGTITAAEAYVEHRALVDGPEAARIDRRVVARIMGGKRMPASGLITLHRARAAGMAELAGRLDGALLAMPTTPHTAPEIAPLEADDELFHRVNLKTLRNTLIGNFLNLPGLAIPNGRDADGLPTSFLLAATGGEDDRLLGAGLGVEHIIRGEDATEKDCERMTK